MSEKDTTEKELIAIGKKSKNQLKRTHQDLVRPTVNSSQSSTFESSSLHTVNGDFANSESQGKPSKSLKNSSKSNLQLILSGNHASIYPSLRKEISSEQTPKKDFSNFHNSSQGTLQITRSPKIQHPISSLSTPLYVPRSNGQNSTDELVPYHDWKVILRNQESNQIILYNRQNHKLAVTSNRNTIKTANKEDSLCHFCRQRLPEGFHGFPSDSSIKTPDTVFVDTDTAENGFNQSYSIVDNSEDNSRLDFMDQNYFRCLASSHSHLGNQRFLVDDISKDPEKEDFRSRSEAEFLSQNSFNQGYYNKFFKEVKKIGKGAKGNVFLCQHVLEDIELGRYAIKKVAIGNNHSWLARMLKEVHMLERLRHPNIIDYKHAWLENHQPNLFAPVVPCLFILMECANGGNLEEFINKRTSQGNLKSPDFERMTPKDRALFLRQQNARKRERSTRNDLNNTQTSNYLSLREILSLFLDICHGLAHLHRYDIVHRDIKPPNLLLSIKDINDTKEIPTVLISDFGECEDANSLRNPTGRTGATGTLEFMAPELLQMSSIGHYVGEHSKKADMWSLGMVLYYLCYSELPYAQIDDLDILRDEILCFQGPIKFPDDSQSSLRIPSQFKRLITLLLSRDPQLRPSVDEILANARDVDFQLLVPGHYYPNSLDSLDKLNDRSSKDSSTLNQRHEIVPFRPENSSKTLVCPVNINSKVSVYSPSLSKPDSPLIDKQPSHLVLKESHLNVVLIGLKMTSILIPCYPTSAHLAASLPLTALAIWGLYSKDSNTQWCLLAIHASFLTFFILAFGSVCSA